MKMKKGVRKFILTLHLVCSLVFGLFIIAVCATGSVLVFGDQIEHVLNPQYFKPASSERNVGINEAEKIFLDNYKGFEISRMDVPSKLSNVYHANMSKGHNEIDAYVDPSNGKLLGNFDREASFVSFVKDLHTHLLLDDIGETIIGIVAIAFILILITGIYLWYPGIKRMFKSLKIKWNKSQMARNLSLHNFIGVITLPFLLVVAITGMLYPFQEKIEESLKLKFTSNYPEELKSVDNGKNKIGLDAITAEIKKLHPEGELYKLRLPSDKEGVIEAQLSDGTYDPEGKGNTSEFYDQFSGKHLGSFSKNNETAYDKFFVWRQSLHRGTYGGVFVKTIYALVGIAPLGLGITGITMWALKRRNKAKKMKKLQKAA
ncbi:hypothetical protein CN601_16390 [Bacillus sp. AFS017336]|nr:hypothetical protein CN692_09875 [Bacillus sp. AFS002410]PEL09401.1 hypothetical protein CN601_16390 [Bacillus sp. AFS017336]